MSALAGPADPYLGTWGLDPSKSDDPSAALSASIAPPAVSAGAASSLSPDGGSTEDDENHKSNALADAMALLGSSGGIEVRASGEQLAVVWTGEPEISVPLTRHYVKVAREPHRWKVRAWMDGPNLVLERRQRSTSVAETFLPSSRPDEVVVVVWVEGASINPPVEFRRVYRALHDAQTASGASSP